MSEEMITDATVRSEIVEHLKVYPRLKQFMFNGLMAKVPVVTRNRILNELINEGTIEMHSIEHAGHLHRFVSLKDQTEVISL